MVEIREYEADLLSLQEEEDDFHASLLYGKETGEAVATEVSMGGASEDHTEAAASVHAAAFAAVTAATSTDDDEDDDDDVVIAEEMEDVHYGISMCMGF